jgi:hypothetical protein
MKINRWRDQMGEYEQKRGERRGRETESTVPRVNFMGYKRMVLT